MAVIEFQNRTTLLFITKASGNVLSTPILTSATGEMVAISFIAPPNPFGSGSLKLKSIRGYVSAVTGGAKFTAYLYSDSPGEPGSSLSTSTETAALTASTWQTITWGTPPTLTSGTHYWIVVKCTTATSAVWQTWVIQAAGTSGGASYTAGPHLMGDASTDGATWNGTARQGMGGFRIGLTNDTDDCYFGDPCIGHGALNASGYRVDGSQELAVVVTAPADTALNARYVQMTVRKQGTPGDCSLKVYLGASTSPAITSQALAVGLLGAGQNAVVFDLGSTLALSGGNVYRFALSAASGSNSTNYYYTYAGAWDADSCASGTVDLRPWSQQIAVLSAGAWGAAQDLAAPLAFFLDSTDPFVAAASGGGPVPGLRVYGPAPSRRRRAA